MSRAVIHSFLVGLVALCGATAHAQAPDPSLDEETGDAAAPGEAADAGPEAVEPQTFPDEPVVATDEPAEATDEPAEATDERIETLDELQIAAARIKLSLNMFGDGSYVLGRDDSGALHQEFVLGALGLLARGELSPSLAAMMELVFEVDEDGATIADLERLHITWKTPRVEVLAGRLHTPFGTWNEHYHHGLWLQLPVERPYVLRFEDDGGFLPIHWLGAMGTAHFDLGTGTRLHLTGGVGNGRGRIEDEILVGGDLDEFKALLLKLEIEQPGAHRWRAGVSGVVDVIAAQPVDVRPALPDQDILELVGNAYVSYRADPLTIISEVYVVDHVSGDRAWVSTDVFALAGYSLGKLTPYALVEWIGSFGGADPFFVPDPVGPRLPEPLIEVLAGVRVDLSTWAALKGELRVTRYTDTGVTSPGLTINWAFGI